MSALTPRELARRAVHEADCLDALADALVRRFAWSGFSPRQARGRVSEMLNGTRHLPADALLDVLELTGDAAILVPLHAALARHSLELPERPGIAVVRKRRLRETG